jgi:nucleoside-diphosphate-sugar epimerase
MNILLIGGTGNISADCASLLHARGHAIFVLTRGRSPVPAAYQAVIADRRDPLATRAALAPLPLEVVINFLGYELSDVQLDYELFHSRVRQYVFISSTSIYAKPPQRLPLTEDAPQDNPWWDYSRKKIACEQWLQQRWAESRFPVTVVRPSHTYSKRWVPNAVSSSSYTFAARIEAGKPVFVHDDGLCPWTLTAASDFALGLAGLVGRPEALGEAFHVTSDEVLSWNQIYAEIAAALPSKLTPPEIVKIPTDFICQTAPRFLGTLKGDKAHPGVFDNSKIKRLVPEFQCRKPFSAGVRESIDWLRAHPAQQNLNPQLDSEIETVIAAWRRQEVS